MVDDDNDVHDVQRPRNEIDEYIDARYVSAPECVHRILSFSMHDHKPSVVRLAVHEQDTHTVTYDPLEETYEDILSREDTSLTAFFEACAKYPDLTANLLYPDAPSKFVLKTIDRKKVWEIRQKGNAVGRVYFCTPSAGERYYVRMLLYHVPGPTSFEYLKVVDGIPRETFQEACAARGLLETDDEWDWCLTEVAMTDPGSQLRELFVSILFHNNPSDPRALFERHAHSLSDDCPYRLQTFHHIDHPSYDQIISLALHEIDHLLQQHGKSLSTYNLPTPSVSFENVDGVCRIVAEEINYDVDHLQDYWEQGYTQANDQQRKVLDSVTSALASGDGGLFFIDGPGGTGKTFVESLLLAHVRSQGHVALAVASSGIASILLEGGRTSHSRFKIPIDVHSESVCSISAQSDLAKLLQMANLIVWDEAPAQHRHCFEAVDRTLKDLRKSPKWFGGITMVFAG
jgi:PIF1-like helicase